MKLLEIKDDKGYYYDNKGEFATVDKITKDDILRLVNMTLDTSHEVEFDEYNVDNLKNKAHQIIYKSIFDKLQDLKRRRDEFRDESDRLFLTEYEKYRDEPETVDDAPSQDAADADTNDDEEIMKMVDDL